MTRRDASASVLAGAGGQAPDDERIGNTPSRPALACSDCLPPRRSECELAEPSPFSLSAQPLPRFARHSSPPLSPPPADRAGRGGAPRTAAGPTAGRMVSPNSPANAYRSSRCWLTAAGPLRGGRVRGIEGPGLCQGSALRDGAECMRLGWTGRRPTVPLDPRAALETRYLQREPNTIIRAWPRGPVRSFTWISCSLSRSPLWYSAEEIRLDFTFSPVKDTS